jgi:peptide/nickel transport system substrate-binding protein
MSETNQNRPAMRLIASFGLLLLALFISAWVGSAVPAQDRVKSAPRKEEEEEPKSAKQATRKPPKEEEEEPVKGKGKPLIRVGDEDEDKQAADKGADAAASDLEREAKNAKNPAVRELFKSLQKPHDVVTAKEGIFLVEPIAKHITPETQFKGLLTLHILTDDWRRGRDYKIGRLSLLRVDPYEHVTLTKVNEFLASRLEREPETSKKHLSRMEMLQEAEKVLAAVIRFHESARLRGLREADGWEEVVKALNDRLQSVQLGQLRALTDAMNWIAAFDMARSLMEKYPKNKDVRVQVAQLLSASADQALQGQDFNQARIRLLLLEKDFPESKEEIDTVRQSLRTRAQAMWEEAEKLAKDDTKAAIVKLQTAEGIFQLPGLHDRILILSNKYPVLYVGVRDLPQNLAPGLAVTDSDRQAVELLYESLVKLTYSPVSGQRYETELVGDMPRLVPLGRRFQILHNAYWSNGQPLTATDVQSTVRLMSDPRWPGYVPEWAEFLDNGKGARVSLDAYHIDLTMRQGYLDPLSFMDFKILPQSLSRAADVGKFAQAPVGSGPFMLDKTKSKAGEDIVFVANPYYAEREGKSGLPRIREIHFVLSRNPAADLGKGGLMQLIPDLPTRRLRDVAPLPAVAIKSPLRNRRIYFLAVNHNKSVLQSQSLRRAIAHAIDREKILNEAFRDGHADFHRSLNGPYPRTSWACNQSIPADPFDLPKARAAAESVKQERPVLPTLTLLYPDDDPAVKQACELMQKQVQEVGITLTPTPRPRRQLHREVEQDNNYDLAYYSWDYPNEAYWIWPLFDPAAAVPGGRNVLRYVNDDQLASFFHKTMTYRDFTKVKRYAHDIHDRIYEQMPFIPLWQLDTHLAYHNTLMLPPDIDPLLIFTDVENWRLEKR